MAQNYKIPLAYIEYADGIYSLLTKIEMSNLDWLLIFLDIWANFYVIAYFLSLLNKISSNSFSLELARLACQELFSK